MAGHEMSESIRDSVTVVLPKGSEVVADGSSLRKASEVRPLTLANTAQKIVMHALTLPLNAAASRTVDPCQFGFVPKRQIVECVAGLENIVF
jgi:hypothetical protein